MLDFVDVAHKASHTQAFLWDKVSKTIVCHHCTSAYPQNIIWLTLAPSIACYSYIL